MRIRLTEDQPSLENIWPKRGIWDPNTQYQKDDVVSRLGRLFGAFKASLGKAPPSTASDNEFWMLLADQGPDPVVPWEKELEFRASGYTQVRFANAAVLTGFDWWGNGGPPLVREVLPETLVDTSQFGAASWTKSGMAAAPVVADAVLNPYETATDADQLVPAANAAAEVFQTAAVGALSSPFYEFGVWLRTATAAQAHNVRIQMIGLPADPAVQSPEVDVPAGEVWSHYKIRYTFSQAGSIAGGIRVRIFPDRSGAGLPVYAWGASLRRIRRIATFPHPIPAGDFVEVFMSRPVELPGLPDSRGYVVLKGTV